MVTFTKLVFSTFSYKFSTYRVTNAFFTFLTAVFRTEYMTPLVISVVILINWMYYTPDFPFQNYGSYRLQKCGIIWQTLNLEYWQNQYTQDYSLSLKLIILPWLCKINILQTYNITSACTARRFCTPADKNKYAAAFSNVAIITPTFAFNAQNIPIVWQKYTSFLNPKNYKNIIKISYC